MGEEKLQHSVTSGTLAIDLGSTTTVVAFSPRRERQVQLLDLPRSAGARERFPA